MTGAVERMSLAGFARSVLRAVAAPDAFEVRCLLGGHRGETALDQCGDQSRDRKINI